MMSSDRTAQLELWREIVSNRNEETRPVTQHATFIRKRFDELDSKGFIWSKESILGIFLQLGLSQRPHEPLPPANEVLELRVHHGIGIPSNEAQESARNEDSRPTTRPVGLMDLPFEVFGMILETLDSIATLEAEEICNQKRLNMVTITGTGARQPYTTYLHENSPILNSIQTFSLTSREIYRRCRPWLWRNLQFPTALPAPIDLWTNNLLLKHGFQVRSLSLHLSENCSKPSGELGHDPFYDNLIPYPMRDLEYVSPNNARDLIARCPNLSTLKFDSLHEEDGDDAGGMENFLSDLVPLISSLKQLQHLHIMNFNLELWKDFPSKVVGSLPLLQTFIIQSPTTSEDQQQIGEGSFGYRLSKLKYLSWLDVRFNSNVDESWCLYDWPKTITQLAIGDCGLTPSSAHRVIQHIAPYVTKLELDFFLDRDLYASWNPESHFSLPFLTDLNITTQRIHLLVSFRYCKSLSRLCWTCWKLGDLKTLMKLILEGTWPQLKKLEVEVFVDAEVEPPPRKQEMDDQIASLEKCCEQLNVKAIISQHWINPASP